MQNPNCDGSGPCRGTEVRVLPMGGDGNVILCQACFNREMIWRKYRNRGLSEEAKYVLPTWHKLEVYDGK